MECCAEGAAVWGDAVVAQQGIGLAEGGPQARLGHGPQQRISSEDVWVQASCAHLAQHVQSCLDSSMRLGQESPWAVCALLKETQSDKSVHVKRCTGGPGSLLSGWWLHMCWVVVCSPASCLAPNETTSNKQ